VSAFVDLLLSELDDAALDLLAERLTPRLAERLGQNGAPQSGWLDVAGAAEYIRCPKSRIYALVSANRISFHKDGSRTLFRREELDEYVRSGGAKRP
jgi:excisionase family DNA binding protein